MSNQSFLNKIRIGWYDVPKIFDWLGIKILSISYIISSILIKKAHLLDTSNIYYKQNLDKLKIVSNNFGFQDFNIFNKCVTISCTYTPIKFNYKKYATRIHFFKQPQSQTYQVKQPLNKTINIQQDECKINFPPIYLIEMEKINIFGSTDLLLKDNLCLYDKIESSNNYGIKSPIVLNVEKDYLSIKYIDSSKSIASGIHLLKDHSINYFHWLIECLPRLLLIENGDIPKHVPLLVDRNLPAQYYEALSIINDPKRKINFIDNRKKYFVKKLYYPSALSVIWDNYDSPIQYGVDVIYSPEAIKYVRTKILTALDISFPAKYSRKIYVSRKASQYRRLINTVAIEEFLTKLGFEIVFPENMSFRSQVEIFSQAEIVIGQSGAGLANILFAPQKCKLLIMMGDHKQTNIHLFGLLAQILDMQYDHILGKLCTKSNINSFHANFQIKLDDLKLYLDKFLINN